MVAQVERNDERREKVVHVLEHYMRADKGIQYRSPKPGRRAREQLPTLTILRPRAEMPIVLLLEFDWRWTMSSTCSSEANRLD